MASTDMASTDLAIAAPARAKALLSDADLVFVLSLLDRDGESARLVGGALRNALLGHKVHEFDIATTARPEVVIARAKAAHVRCVPTGLEHGTVTLVVSGHAFEVTTLREDVETDGRRAKVRFSRDFASDALRRDFTVNALSMTLDGMLFDYVGGLADIEARRLRFIGEPTQRIREDYLRILRFFRFAAEYSDGPLDAEGLRACMREREGLARLSRERIRTEVLKLLAARRAAEITEAICHAGLLGPVLALAPNPARLKALLRIEADAPRDPLLALVALCVNVPEDAQHLRERLRLSNAEEKRLTGAAEALVATHGLARPPPAQGLLRLLFRHGRQAAGDALTLAHAEASDKAAADWSLARLYLRDAREPHLPFSGADLVARGLPSGRAVGAALKDLQARWITAGFPEDPRRLAALLEAAARAATGDSDEAT
jgi:poly(A) polymerase